MHPAAAASLASSNAATRSGRAIPDAASAAKPPAGRCRPGAQAALRAAPLRVGFLALVLIGVVGLKFIEGQESGGGLDYCAAQGHLEPGKSAPGSRLTLPRPPASPRRRSLVRIRRFG
jgi:hypothetical protein